MRTAPERLSPGFLGLLKSGSPNLFFSAASAWELTIKVSLGKLTLPVAPDKYMQERMEGTGITELPVNIRHAVRTAMLASIHKDPFDRVLAAQALIEDLTVITVDPVFQKYGCRTLDPAK